MSGKYQKYQDTKDSGLFYLDNIPSHWETKQIVRTIDKCLNGIWGQEPSEKKENVVVFRVADFDREKLGLKKYGYTYRYVDPKDQERRLVRNNDLLIEKSGGGEKTLVGQVVISNYSFNAVCSNFVGKMTPINTNSRFLNYIFSSLYHIRINYCSIKQNTGIQNLDADSYLREKFCFPGYKEQTQIANFLDYETAKIDTLIEKQKKLIELLKEKRQAVISHAVTKGLNPDAPMKDSGVEWLGEVPEHWEVSKLLYSCDLLKDGTHLPPPRVENGIPLLSVRNIIENRFQFRDDDSQISKADYDILCKPFSPREDDILLAIVGATLGKVAIVRKMSSFHIQRSLAIIRSDKKRIVKDYLYFILRSKEFQNLLWQNVGFSAQPGIYLGSLANFKIPIPSLETQNEIITYLYQKVSILDDAINKNIKAISLLQERRTALISAAVTGKIDVRDWVAPESREREKEAVL